MSAKLEMVDLFAHGKNKILFYVFFFRLMSDFRPSPSLRISVSFTSTSSLISHTDLATRMKGLGIAE